MFGVTLGLDTVKEGEASLAGESGIARGMLFTMQAALTYALALLVAISWHQTAHKVSGWRNVFDHNWAQWAPQVLSVVLMSGLAAVVCVVGFNVYATIGVVGYRQVMANAWPVLAAAIEYEGPRALLGSLLAFFVILIVDAWRSVGRGSAWLPWLPLAAAAWMLLGGVGARLMSAQVAASAGGRTLDLGSWEVWASALSAGAWAGLIGAAVAFLTRETLIHEFSRMRDDARPPARSSAPLPAE